MKDSRRFLNIACGDTFVEDEYWTNIDFTSHSPKIKKANILNGLPYKDNTFDVVYSSHFIEHIPIDSVNLFLKDVYRIMKPGGLLRIVTPDLEFLNNEYKKNLDLKFFNKANFITTLILDQCVRTVAGGKLKLDMDSFHNSNDKEMIEYAKLLIGPDAFKYIELDDANLLKKIYIKIKKDPKFLLNVISMIRIKFFLFFLPKSYKSVNVSTASIGEKHMWLYDFNSLSDFLNNSSFNNIKKADFDDSSYYKYIFSELDIKDGLPRKGIHQLFVEAYKA